MTLSMTRSVLETGRAIGGQSIQEHNEIIGMDAALHFLNGTMLGKNNPLKVRTADYTIQTQRGFLCLAQVLS